MRTADAFGQFALEKVLVAAEAHAGAAHGMFDTLRLGGKVPLEDACHIINVGRSGEVRLAREIGEHLRHLVQALPRALQVVRNGEEPRQQQLLAFVERREWALEQQEDALHRCFGETDGIAGECG